MATGALCSSALLVVVAYLQSTESKNQGLWSMSDSKAASLIVIIHILCWAAELRKTVGSATYECFTILVLAALKCNAVRRQYLAGSALQCLHTSELMCAAPLQAALGICPEDKGRLWETFWRWIWGRIQASQAGQAKEEAARAAATAAARCTGAGAAQDAGGGSGPSNCKHQRPRRRNSGAWAGEYGRWGRSSGHAPVCQRWNWMRQEGQKAKDAAGASGAGTRGKRGQEKEEQEIKANAVIAKVSIPIMLRVLGRYAGYSCFVLLVLPSCYGRFSLKQAV